MCEFCTKHGEGRKWYLQMKNYAQELLHNELSASQKEITKAATRLECVNRFWRVFEMPAITGVHVPRGESWEESRNITQSTKPGIKLNEKQIITRKKIERFGQVIPIEDVEKVVDMVDSITRMPCGCRFLTTGKIDKRYCFGIAIDRWGVLDKFPDAASSLEVLDKEETKKIFRQYDQEGLMHSIWTSVTPYVEGICNCDRDCNAYRGYIEKRGIPSFFRAEYICRVNWDL